jgi:hypothetical protein
MFATLEFRIFYLRVSYSENQKMKIYKNITLYLLLCGSETLFFTL